MKEIRTGMIYTQDLFRILDTGIVKRTNRCDQKKSQVIIVFAALAETERHI